MIALGVYLRPKGAQKYLKAIGVVSMNKFFVSPLVAYILCTLLNLGELTSDVIILESAMPPAIMNGVLVSRYSFDPSSLPV